jgi:hypothetical protein
MAKRVTKIGTESKKQSAAAKRTVKKGTPVKKAPVKKSATKKQTKTTLGAVAKKAKPKKTIKKVPPKASAKKVTKKTTLAEAAKAKIPVVKKKRRAKNPRVHVRISENATKDKFSAMWERVKDGELKWAYYAIDGNVGYHHYLVLKKK